MTPRKPLAGRRIVIVEDEFLVAIDIADVLEDLGAQVVAKAATLAQARSAVAGGVDGAVLDVKIGDEESTGIAEQLDGAGVPFIFTTGADGNHLPADLRRRPRLAKPISHDDLANLAIEIFAIKR